MFWWPGADTEHKYADDRAEYTSPGMKCSPELEWIPLVIHQPIVFHFNRGSHIMEGAGDIENDDYTVHIIKHY